MTEPPHDPLLELGRRIGGGDLVAFEELFRRVYAPLCEVVDGYVRSPSAAEEIVQDLLFQLWMTRGRREVRTSLRGYIFAAARNRALHYLRHQAVVHRWSERASHDPADGTIGTPAPQPDALLEESELATALQHAISQLPPRTRVAIVLRLEHQMTHAEIATAMGITTKGVEKLLATAQRKLRVLLGPHAPERSLDAKG